MSCFRLPKKLLPSKKACKSLISTLTTRLRRPKTRHHYHHRLHHNPASSPGIHHLRRRGHPYVTTIFVDRLFPVDPARSETPATRQGEAGVSSACNAPATACRGSGGGKGDKWKEYLESLPPIRGVDERAEEFITGFRQQMKIEREQSLLDFQEMLARSY